MAENEKPADNVDALAAMSKGADLNELDPYAEQAAQAEEQGLGDPAAGEFAQVAPGTNVFEQAAQNAGAGPAGGATKAASQKKLQAQTNDAMMRQLKKLLIPVLIAVGGMLAVIALVCGFGGVWLNIDFREFRRYAMLVAPMAVLLLVGAYWLRLDLSRGRKK